MRTPDRGSCAHLTLAHFAIPSTMLSSVAVGTIRRNSKPPRPSRRAKSARPRSRPSLHTIIICTSESGPMPSVA